MGLSSTQILELLQKDQSNRVYRYPENFDRAALFLLDMRFDNLFEPTGDPSIVRCKGCQKKLKSIDREQHHADHKRECNAT